MSRTPGPGIAELVILVIARLGTLVAVFLQGLALEADGVGGALFARRRQGEDGGSGVVVEEVGEAGVGEGFAGGVGGEVVVVVGVVVDRVVVVMVVVGGRRGRGEDAEARGGGPIVGGLADDDGGVGVGGAVEVAVEAAGADGVFTARGTVGDSGVVGEGARGLRAGAVFRGVGFLAEAGGGVL